MPQPAVTQRSLLQTPKVSWKTLKSSLLVTVFLVGDLDETLFDGNADEDSFKSLDALREQFTVEDFFDVEDSPLLPQPDFFLLCSALLSDPVERCLDLDPPELDLLRLSGNDVTLSEGLEFLF